MRLRVPFPVNHVIASPLACAELVLQAIVVEYVSFWVRIACWNPVVAHALDQPIVPPEEIA
jgi:hypothetical protein